MVEVLKQRWSLPQAWGFWRVVVYVACQHRFYVFPSDRKAAEEAVNGGTAKAKRALGRRDDWRQEALAKLQRGDREGFRHWRAQTHYPLLWLAGSDMQGWDLRDIDWRQCVLAGVRFDGANLSGSLFAGSVLQDVSFEGAHLAGANFDGHDLSLLDLPPEGTVETKNRWLKPQPPVRMVHLGPMQKKGRSGVAVKLQFFNRTRRPHPILVTVRAGEVRREQKVTVQPLAKQNILVSLSRVAAGTVIEAWSASPDSGQKYDRVVIGTF